MPKHDWKQFFPYKSIRPGQEQAINEILDAFESDKRLFVLEAGTGIGKSAVAVTVGRYMTQHFETEEGFQKGCNILTTQKLLQEQYNSDYPAINSLKSSSNYSCNFHKKVSCNDSRKLLQTEPKGTSFWRCCAISCVYKRAKEKFMADPFGVTNFAYFLTETRYSKKLPKKSLLIIDEAHNVPDELSRFIEVTFSDRFAKSFIGMKLPDKITPAMFVKWVSTDYYPALVRKVKAFRSGLEKFTTIKSRVESGEFSKLSRQLEILTGHEQKVLSFLALYDKNNWLMTEVPPVDRSGRRVEFKPIDVAPYAHDYLLKMGKYVLMMSATIVDTHRFGELCGITGKFASLVLPCPFPIENRPIVYSGVGKMSAREIDSSLPKLAAAVKEILKSHKGEKGIIHTHTYKIAWYLKRVLSDRRIIIHNSENRIDMLQKHIKSKKDTVLISPSMTEGVDLKDDLSRFQIVCKIPFPYLGDQLTRKKMNKWKWWYDFQTAKTVIQSSGRSVRSETDTAVTYILDASWERFFENNRSMFGPEFL